MRPAFLMLACLLAPLAALPAAETEAQPFRGITLVTRTETSPRNVTLRVLKVDLTAPGISFRLTQPGGARETVRQRTVDFLEQQHAQFAINAHFFLPYPSEEPDADLVGFAASEGKVFSRFESPAQSYALVRAAPALVISKDNHAIIAHADPAATEGTITLEKAAVWTAVSGSAQIVTEGVKTIPEYVDADHAGAALTPGGPGQYSNQKSWYAAVNARTAIGLTRDARTLVIAVVDRGAPGGGLAVGELADLLIRDFGVYNALNLDGGGSATLAMQDPATGRGEVINQPSDTPAGRAVGSNLAIFAPHAGPPPRPDTVGVATPGP